MQGLIPAQCDTWCGNDDVWVGCKLRKLRFHGVTTNQDRHPEVGVLRQLLDDLTV